MCTYKQLRTNNWRKNHGMAMKKRRTIKAKSMVKKFIKEYDAIKPIARSKQSDGIRTSIIIEDEIREAFPKGKCIMLVPKKTMAARPYKDDSVNELAEIAGKQK